MPVITSIIENRSAFAKADTATIVAVLRWMIRHPSTVADLVTKSAAAWDFSVAVLVAAEPRATSAQMSAEDIAYYGDDPAEKVRLMRHVDHDVVKDIVVNHDVDLLTDEISRIFWLPDKKDVMAAMAKHEEVIK